MSTGELSVAIYILDTTSNKNAFSMPEFCEKIGKIHEKIWSICCVHGTQCIYYNVLTVMKIFNKFSNFGN